MTQGFITRNPWPQYNSIFGYIIQLFGFSFQISVTPASPVDPRSQDPG